VPDVMLLENGQTAIVDTEGLMPGTSVPVGRIHVDNGVEVPDEILRERVLLSEVGVVFVTVPIDRDGHLAGVVTVASRGIVTEGGLGSADAAAAQAVEAAVKETYGRGASLLSLDAVRDTARRAARKVFGRAQRKPLVVVSIAEV